MEKSFTLIEIAAVAIIIAVVVAMAIMVTDGGKARFNKATRQLNSAASEFDNPALQIYDGATITGAEVIIAINRHASNKVGITVKTNMNPTGLKYIKPYNSTTRTANDEINDMAVFTGKLVRDNNGVITDLIFTQE